MKILITGVAGFIGFHVARYLLSKGYEVTGIDNINTYYDIKLKKARLKILIENGIEFYKLDISKKYITKNFFINCQPEYVLHFAAQAGVRYSIKNPYAYLNSNLIGFLNVIEGCRNNNVKNFIYASSSSVYGGSKDYPFHEEQKVDTPISLYAATKKSNELIAHSYSHLYGIQSTGLRFFTVYGPWGRPDMAYFIFLKNILNETPITVFGDGNSYRDFTYIDDVVTSIEKLMLAKPKKQNFKNKIKAEIFNIGNSQPIHLLSFIKIIEKLTNKKAKIFFSKKQDGDVDITSADINKILLKTGFSPSTKIDEGMKFFFDWYTLFYNK